MSTTTLALCLILFLGMLIGTSNLIYVYAQSANDNNMNNTLVKNGRISSMVLGIPQNGTFDINSVPKFLLSGDWNITINNNKSPNFMANFTVVSTSGTNLHNHKFINFKQTNDTLPSNQIESDNKNIKLSGTIDISMNDDLKWKNINTNISTYDDNTITIDFDDKATGNHFIGQPVYGTVE